MKEFVLKVRVYIEDTDAGGIVYYVNYLRYMERARTEMLRSLGFGKAGANPGGLQFVVRSAEVKYLAPARLDDELEVTAQVMRLGGASLDFIQQIRCSEQLLCEGRIGIACVEGASLRPKPVDAAMKRALVNQMESKEISCE